jgi:hypothetical protein
MDAHTSVCTVARLRNESYLGTTKVQLERVKSIWMTASKPTICKLGQAPCEHLAGC